MKKFITLFLVFSILALSGNVFAKERKGADLIVQKTDETQVRGELIAVKQTSLLLLERDSGADMTVSIDDIRIIIIAKKSKFLSGAGVGLLIGTAVGAVIGSSLEFSSYWGVPRTVFGMVIGGVLGAIGAGLIGASLGENKEVQIEGKSDAEIQEILEELRKKARIRNFQ